MRWGGIFKWTGIRPKIVAMIIILLLLLAGSVGYLSFQLQSMQQLVVEQNGILEQLSEVIAQSDTVVKTQTDSLKKLETVSKVVVTFGEVREWYTGFAGRAWDSSSMLSTRYSSGYSTAFAA